MKPHHPHSRLPDPKLNFLLRRMLLVEMETGRAFFESLNLYGLLQYQARRTRSDADTFGEGWQIICPSTCLIAWPLFTKWWGMGGGWGVTALNGARVNEGPAQEMHISPRQLAVTMSVIEVPSGAEHLDHFFFFLTSCQIIYLYSTALWLL